MRPLPFVVSVASLLLAGCGRYEVTRVYSGTARVERFIDEDAYREFTQAAELEARGELRGAQAAYLRVLEHDPESLEARTRLGELACRLRESEAAWFREVERRDATFAPLWRARAACAKRKGSLDAVAVERAYRFDPSDDELVIDQIDALLATSRATEAFALARELVARSPVSREAWRAMRRTALAAQEPLWQRESELRERSLAARAGAFTVSDRGLDAFAREYDELLASLVTREDDQARRRALEWRLGAAEFAAVALLAGRPDLVVELAERTLAADPHADELRCLGALAAGRAGDSVRRERWLSELRGALKASMGPLGPLGAAALDELVAREGRADVAAWRDASVAVQAANARGSDREKWLAERMRSRRAPTNQKKVASPAL
jgi:hypothetical protein